MHGLEQIQAMNAAEVKSSADILDRELERILTEPEERILSCKIVQEPNCQAYLFEASEVVVTDEMIERFKKAWHSMDVVGFHGRRVRAGLEAVFRGEA